jgi:anaerobic magnesium-protoporphyrin IX monomethyl ester cyclase
MFAFVRPPAPFNRYIQNVPLNYIHLAAWLRRAGREVHILDQVVEGVNPEYVDRYIREHGVRVVGIGCMTCELPAAVEEARRLKEAHPGLQIVFGGAHPSGDPEECLRTGVVDYVIVGEGEISLTGLLEDLDAGREPGEIAGVWRLRNGVVQPAPQSPVPNVHELPRPAYDLLDLKKYFRLDSPWHFPKSAKAVQFITSRGCPYQCSYCHEIHGKKFRGMAPEVVLDQMEWLVRQYGVREFMIVDDIFNFEPERAKQICRGILERKLNVHLQFPNGVRGDRFDQELVGLMKQAGTHFMAVAIETVSEKFQKLIRKNLKIDRALQTIEWVNQQGIEVSGFFMIGFPGETLEEVQRTIDFAVNAPLDTIFLSIVSPFKGTKLRTDMLNGRFGEMDSDGKHALDQLFPIIHNRQLPAEVLSRIQREAYWRFYMKPRSLVNLGKKLTNGRNVKKIVRAVRRRITDREPVSVN